jgi:hypothetical protein
VLAEAPPTERQLVQSKVRFLNTVIGKMSGVITDPLQLHALGLTPITPEAGRAFLVEAFNRILISRIHFDTPGFQRGIQAFIEKDDLLPFEEAKLFGHNATHAWLRTWVRCWAPNGLPTFPTSRSDGFSCARGPSSKNPARL